MFGLMFGFKVVAHLEDDSVGGLQNSITRMLQADPDFGKHHLIIFIKGYTCTFRPFKFVLDKFLGV